MSAVSTQQPPSIPPRPSRADKDAPAMPRIPPRPVNKRLERSVSPNPDRFAPSPLNAPPLSRSPGSSLLSSHQLNNSDPIERSRSVDLPTVGEEGQEYDALVETEPAGEPLSRTQSSSPEHTRTIGSDLKLHAPKPTFPAMSAKQRVAAVTRTDSDRAASFGIGRPSSEEQTLPSNRSLKKKASTTSQLSSGAESHLDDEQGIPEIGQQVPMYPNAGDVQAPSPAPGMMSQAGVVGPDGVRIKNHKRKTSSRGFAELPPGSYGLHGHGVEGSDKLEQAYYDKHPELRKLEHHPYHADRPNDFSMSKEALNKIIRETAARGSAAQSGVGTPSEQIGWQAIDETTSRTASPRPGSVGPKSENLVTSPLKQAFKPEVSVSEPEQDQDNGIIHVEVPNRRRSEIYGDEATGSGDAEDDEYNVPILAEDEVAKGPSFYEQPAVEPERRSSSFDLERPESRTHSRPTSRPTSIYREPSAELRSTPLEDVEEYEPLFPEDEKAAKKAPTLPDKLKENTQRFPSRDIWEDAPNSVYYTAEVSTPDVVEQAKRSEIAQREGETPAQAFARHQEELAEKESLSSESFLHRKQKALWTPSSQSSTRPAAASRPVVGPRFPSRDVWEDSPDSLQLQTIVSGPQAEKENSPVEASKVPVFPQRPARKPDSSSPDKPSVPERPKPKHTPSDEGVTTKPTIPERPKPAIPSRPAKHSPVSNGSTDGSAAAPAPAPKPKPAVPARPMGGKIAALQAGFMSDLNKRLQLGPQAPPKKEEPAAAEEAGPQEEKVPLSDARKSRARGPQRRAPAAAATASAASTSEPPKPTLAFSTMCTVFSIDPDEGLVSITSKAVAQDHDEPATAEKEAEEIVPEVAEPEVQKSEAPATEPVEAKEEAEPAEEADEAEEKEEKEEKEEQPAAATSPPAEEKLETLATNMAGEPVVEATVEADEEQHVEPIEGVEN